MRIYKKGDRVRILKAVSYEGTDLSDFYNVGDICEAVDRTDGAGDTRVYTKDRSDYFWFALDAIEPAVKTWETLGEGDVLVREESSNKIVQGLIGDIVFYISTDGVSGYASIEELKDLGWKIKDAEPEDITEVTLEQVADKLGISVEKLRIKD